MSAEHVYGDALTEAPPLAGVGLKSAMEAINDGEFRLAAEFLRAAADHLEADG